MVVPHFLTGEGGADAPTILSGFAAPVSGAPFAFKSFHPLAERGLILRAEAGANAVAWRTSPLRYDTDSAVACFVWIAGYASGTSSGDRNYTLRVNGDPWVTFAVRARVESGGWSVPGLGGTMLRFESRWKDWAGDEYGYMTLEVPRGLLREREPLELRLEGEEGDPRDWFNVFSYPFEERAEAAGHSALVHGAMGPRQLIGIFVDHVRKPSPLHIRTGSGEELHGVAEFGYNVYALEVPPVQSESKLPVTVSIAGEVLFDGLITLRRVQERTFYLLPHSHNDIGYSDHQEAMLLKQFRNIDDALDLIDKTGGYPPEARFKWNVEILWTVEQWLARASADQRARFERAVREGRLGLDALFGNMLTGLSRPEEHIRMTHYARQLGRELGVPIVSAMSGDIPGFVWGIVPALAQSGVRSFSSGPNYQPFLPDTGDRVGHSNRAWCDRPFYWRSPSRKEKILFWMAGKGYSWFHDWILGKARNELAHQFYGYLRELEDSAYPYGIVQLRYTIGADNGPTDPGLPDFVRAWNARHITPRFVIATTAEMFEEFERRYGASLPTFEGELTPYWEDGALSTLRELGLARGASQRLVQAETFSAMVGPADNDRRALDAAWRQITLFHEHTWGAFNSITDPDCEFVRTQWEVKKSFSTEAERQSRAVLLHVADRRAGEEASRAVDVINTSSWKRTGVVFLPAERAEGVRCLRDEVGVAVTTQRLSTGELAFLAEDVPSLGTKRFSFENAAGVDRGDVWIDGWKIGNRKLAVEIDPASGAFRSVRDLERGVELVDPDSGMGMNEFLYVPGLDPAKSKRCGRPSVTALESGPLLAALEIASEAPGCVELRRRIRIAHDSPLVEIENILVRKRVRTKEGIHFAFPFRIPRGEILLDGGWGIVRPERDQLAGSCKDFFYAQRWVDVANEDFGCTLVTVESPIVEIGSMTSEVRANNGVRRWRTEVDGSTTVFSYVMNNYWHTNYRADQEGFASVRYALAPHGRRDLAACARLGIEVQQPLLLFPAKGPVHPGLFSLCSADAPGSAACPVMVPWIENSRDGRALMVRLFNAGGKRERVRFRWGSFRPGQVRESSPFEEEGPSLGDEMVMDPWEFKTLRCTT